jgi:hypothetical protein
MSSDERRRDGFGRGRRSLTEEITAIVPLVNYPGFRNGPSGVKSPE